MNPVVFTDWPGRTLKLPYFARSGGRKVDTRPLKQLKRALPSLEMAPMVYLDVRGRGAAEVRRLLAIVGASPAVRFCVLDPSGEIEDVAAVFHAGAIDYLGKRALAVPFDQKRARAVLAFARRRVGEIAPALASEPVSDLATAAVDGWKEIQPGREYAFSFLFIEIDDAEDLKLRHEPENLAAAMTTFRDFVEGMARPHGGRLWMWSRFGGLVLFPLHRRSAVAGVCGLRIMLSSIFYDCEGSLLPGRLSFRMALSVGSTVYHAGETGKIISESVNSIFHLGRRYARPSQFLVTEDAFELMPSQLRAFFTAAGTYEGDRIYRMLRPSPAAGAR